MYTLFLGISPVRISFAGGGTDMPEFYEKYGGKIVTSAINHFTYVIINKRNDNFFQFFSSDFHTHNKPAKFEDLKSEDGNELAISVVKHLNYRIGSNLMICSDVAPHSGLGSSSSLAVNLVKVLSTLKGENLDKDKIAETAHYIERHFLNWPMGKQDEYISVYGGFNLIEFTKDTISVSPILLKRNTLLELEQNLLLFFVGGRTDTKILPTQVERIRNEDKEILESLHSVKKLAETMHRSLLDSDLTTFGELLNKGWQIKKKFSKGVTNNTIDRIYDVAVKSGALGGKLTGAGGGGHLLLYCDPKKQISVKEKMEEFGLREVKFNFHNEGSKILDLYEYTSPK